MPGVAGAAAAAPLPQRDGLPLAGMQVRPSGDRKIGRLLPSAILCVHFFLHALTMLLVTANSAAGRLPGRTAAI